LIIELLFIKDCPNYLETWAILEEVLESEKISASINMVNIETLEDAQRLQFPGSPTIRIDGHDMEESGEVLKEFKPSYRRYKGSSGPRGMPSRESIRRALLSRTGKSSPISNPVK
jgi:hypothetical protein